MEIEQFVQIAGIIDQEEAELLQNIGIHFLGFPLRLPFHKEDLSEKEAAEIIKGLKPPSRGVLITYLRDAHALAEFSDFLGAKIVQLHGDISLEETNRLKKMRPALTLFKSLIVRENNFEALKRMTMAFSPCIDAFVTDTFDPSTGASGATGKTHDWSISKKLVKASPKPIILAGGLNPKNVREAINEVRPAGVDSHTGVERFDGRKDRDLIRQFREEARQGFLDLR